MQNSRGDFGTLLRRRNQKITPLIPDSVKVYLRNKDREAISLLRTFFEIEGVNAGNCDILRWGLHLFLDCANRDPSGLAYLVARMNSNDTPRRSTET